jgi:2-hydroxy-6-oxonona-2,4-dienedioate hydrolase
MISYPLGAGRVITRILEAGTGPRSVLFIHGLGARADRWRVTLDAFATAGYHGYALDLPGHGFATKGSAFPYGVPGFVGFTNDVLHELGLVRPIIVGTSLGAHIGAYLACEQPSGVEALVLVGALGIVPIGREAGEAIRRNVRETSRDSIEAKLRFVFADHSLVTEQLVEEEYRINNSPGAAESFERLGDYIAEEIDRDGIGPRLATLATTLPVLLVWGEIDKAVPMTVARNASSLLGRPRLITISGAGHAPYLEQPDAFHAHVLAFLKTLT